MAMSRTIYSRLWVNVQVLPFHVAEGEGLPSDAS